MPNNFELPRAKTEFAHPHITLASLQSVPSHLMIPLLTSCLVYNYRNYPVFFSFPNTPHLNHQQVLLILSPGHILNRTFSYHPHCYQPSSCYYQFSLGQLQEPPPNDLPASTLSPPQVILHTAARVISGKYMQIIVLSCFNPCWDFPVYLKSNSQSPVNLTHMVLLPPTFPSCILPLIQIFRPHWSFCCSPSPHPFIPILFPFQGVYSVCCLTKCSPFPSSSHSCLLTTQVSIQMSLS